MEDEVHVLLQCEARIDLVMLQAVFQQDVDSIVGGLAWVPDLLQQLKIILHDQRLTERVARYIYVVLGIFSSVPMYIPPPYTYMPLAAA